MTTKTEAAPKAKTKREQVNELERLQKADLRALREAAHHEEQLAMLDAGVSLPGLRLTRSDKPDEGLVVTLTAKEQEPVIAAIRKVLAARA